MEIKKVQQRKDGTKFLVIPRNSEIYTGDYVAIMKVANVDFKLEKEVKPLN